jgi:signal transduction histidine kinase
MRSLRTRLILSHILPVLVILPLVVAILVYLLETQILAGSIVRELTDQAVLVASLAGERTEIWYDPETAQTFVTQVGPRLTAKLMLLDPKGRLLGSSDPTDTNLRGQVIDIPGLANLTNPLVNTEQPDMADVIVPVITPNKQLIGYVRMANPLASVFERSQALRQVTLWVLLGGLLSGGLLGWLLAGSIARPLRRATQAVDQLASGEHPTALDEKGPEEVRQLFHAFNILVERLNVMEHSRQRLLANLVHELGRPLGALQSAVQALLGGAEQDEALRHDLLSGMQDELRRLGNLVEELGHLYHQILGSLELHTENTSPSEWLGRVLPAWEKAAQEKQITWDSAIPDDLPEIAFDPDRLAQALGNLLSNAVRYTPNGGTIKIEARMVDNLFEVSVSDNGPGLSPEELERVFEPFYRSQAGRRFPQGMGLGLPIARDITQAHHGQLLAESKLGQGSCFTLQIPVSHLI